MSGARITVRVRPSARRSRVIGYTEGLVRVDVSAPATENRANDELIKLLAGALGVGKGHVRIVHGAAARQKLVEVDLPAERVDKWLNELSSTYSPPAPNR